MGEHVSGGAANIDDDAETGEVVCRGDGFRLCTMYSNHRFTKLSRQFRMLRQIIEDRHTEDLFHRGLAGLH